MGTNQRARTSRMNDVMFASWIRSGDGIHNGCDTLIGLYRRRVLFLFVDAEPAGEIVRQRGGMIERAGMQPDARGAGLPGALRRFGQEVAAEPASGELRQQAEVRDLDAAILVPLQFEVAGR